MNTRWEARDYYIIRMHPTKNVGIVVVSGSWQIWMSLISHRFGDRHFGWES